MGIEVRAIISWPRDANGKPTQLRFQLPAVDAFRHLDGAGQHKGSKKISIPKSNLLERTDGTWGIKEGTVMCTSVLCADEIPVRVQRRPVE